MYYVETESDCKTRVGLNNVWEICVYTDERCFGILVWRMENFLVETYIHFPFLQHEKESNKRNTVQLKPTSAAVYSYKYNF